LDLRATAALLSRHAAIEARLHAIVGRWAADEPDPAARLLLAEQAVHHGWHASLLAERIPAVDPGDDRGGAGVDDDLAPLAGRTGTLERLVALDVVVVPARVAGYEEALAAMARPTDGPAMRALRLVASDQRADATLGEALARAMGGDAVDPLATRLRG
jgi:hypothetical protein